jgi:lipopolysaccharide transport system ATP-binding protein
MNDTVIRAENISKKYIIGHQAERGGYTALRDVLMHNAQTFWQKTKDLATGKPVIQGDTLEEVWALKDVSFEIRRGETVGIIGRNGAGKSTLLKIISRITEPSAGRLIIDGRVASLLEVGTGFHPELSGRENIYLNGTILGMTRKEIKRKFDEIVAFAEVEKYLDTPVKRYSSGMYVRLAFAVAAHLEPEILVVDEVLAVGDAAFQKKCLGKMGNIAQEGRTVLFVSHNMTAINHLCSKGIWLQNGQVQQIGTSSEIVGSYLAENIETASQVFFRRRPNATIQYLSASVTDGKGNVSKYIPDDQAFSLDLEIEAYESTPDIYFGMILQNAEGINVLFADSRDVENQLPTRFQRGKYKIRLKLPPILAPGTYSLALGIAAVHPLMQLDNIESACSFEIVQNSNKQRTAPRPGIVSINLPWKLQEQNR